MEPGNSWIQIQYSREQCGLDYDFKFHFHYGICAHLAYLETSHFNSDPILSSAWLNQPGNRSYSLLTLLTTKEMLQWIVSSHTIVTKVWLKNSINGIGVFLSSIHTYEVLIKPNILSSYSMKWHWTRVEESRRPIICVDNDYFSKNPFKKWFL